MSGPTSARSSGTFTMDSNHSTSAIEVWDRGWGSFHLTWTGTDAFNGTAIMQGSNDGTLWNDLGGASGGTILLTTPDSQVWEFTKFTTRYIRLDYTANNITTGTATWYYEAKR